jgi:hypothetical protein
MRILITAVGLLLASCGSSSTPDDTSTDPGIEPVDAHEVDAVDARDTAPDPPADTPADEADPPLGICGEYCEGESRPCPEGAFCEYGAMDPTYICTHSGCGFCAWVPIECPPEDEPDCGCDGVVYPNRCERRRARALPDPSWMSCAAPDDVDD